MAGPINVTKTFCWRAVRIESPSLIFSTIPRWFSSGPTQLLKERIQSGKLNQDDFQLKVIKHLQVVYDEIVSYAPKSGFAKFFFKPHTPKGLYVYGSVGGGKTMLMDLFYETCQVKKCWIARF